MLVEDLSAGLGCEFNPTAPCAVDLDSDGVVGTSDVMLILSEFGCSANCAFDLDGNTSVGVSDVLALLSQFGETC